VRVPRFALYAAWEAWRRAEGADGEQHGGPHWDARPLALVRDGRVVEATPAARQAGVLAGAEAAPWADGASVRCLPWDAAVSEAAVAHGTARLLTATAQVTPVAGALGMWWAGVGSPEQPGGGERGTGHALARAARRWHPRARVAVASSCVAARAAVWGGASAPGRQGGAPGAPLLDALADAVRVVPRGGCAAFLADAPIGFVPMDDVLRRAVLEAGVRTVGDFAARPAEQVVARWGAAGVAAWRLARGEDQRRPVLGAEALGRAVAAELATPTRALDPVLAIVRAALERLAAQLAAERRLAAAVALTLTLDDGRGARPAGGLPHTVTRELRLPCPLAGAAAIFSRCRALLQRWPLAVPVCAVRVEVTATAPAPRPSVGPALHPFV
jgi:protein ImuB